MGGHPLFGARRFGISGILRASGALLVSGLVLLAAGLPASAAPPRTTSTTTVPPAPKTAKVVPTGGVTLKLTPTVQGHDYTGKDVFSGQVVQYNLALGNTGSTTGTVTIIDALQPGIGNIIPADTTCGTVPNCSFAMNGTRQLIYTISSVAGGASGLEASYQVTILPKRDIYQSAQWTGGCAKQTCKANVLVNPIVGPPVALSSNPGNRSPVADGQTITYTLTVLPYAFQSGDSPVVISDPVPTGTTYVAGSATCGSVPGCTASESGGIVTFTLDAASFAAATNFSVDFDVVNNTPSGTIIDSATWTGGTCDVATCKAQPIVTLDATPAGATSPGGGTTTTTVPTTASHGSTTPPTTTPHVTTAAATGTLAYTGLGEGARAMVLIGLTLVGTALVLGPVSVVLEARRRLRHAPAQKDRG